MAGLLLPLAAVGGIAATWYQLPGAVIAWLVVLVTAWTEPPVELTGKKDAYGYPTPANPEQEAKLASLRAWKAMRWRLLAPGAHWLPGWPVLASWLAALVGALLVLAVPVTLPAFAVELLPAPGPGGVVVAPDGSVSIAGSTDYAALVSAFGPAVNALATFVLLTAAGATRRDRLGHGCPGVRVNSLPAAIRANPLAAGLSTLGALVGAGALLYALTTFVPSARVQVTTVPTWCWAVAAAALVLAAQWPAWSHAALDRWREVVGARRTWADRWPSVKMADPAADLVDRITAGGVVVDVFDAPTSIGASGYLALAPRLAPVVGSGHDVVVLGHPQMGEKGPIPGSTDPRRFRVVDIEGDARPDLGDPALDDDVMELMVEVGMAQAADALGWDRPALAAVSPVHDPGSAGAVYKVEWVGLSWPTLRTQVGSLPGFFGCEVLVDHHGQAMYLGVLTVVAEPPVDAELAAKFVQLARQDKWNAVWGTASLERHKTSQPVVYHPKYATAELPGGAVLERVVLTTRQGIPPEDYFGTEKKLAATLNGAPFVAVTGFPGASGRPGDRHPQAICVYSCAQPVPATLNALAPVQGAAVAQVDPDPEQPGSRGRGARPPRPRPERPAPTADLATTWVIAGALNRAFEQIKLPRPEVVGAHALTRGRARAVHLWKVEVRLHGDTSLSDVRSRAEKLRQALGVPWLRVAEAPDGVTLYAGAEPGRVSLVNPVTDGATLVSLDWEQAFNDSGLLGSGGRLPQLAKVGALEHNAEVAVLDFALPSGLDVNMVRAAIRRLKSSTGNDFIELRASPLGPSHARLLVCGVNPLPERAAFDFEAAACSEELLFATGIEGQPVGFDPTSSPHLLVAGVTGGGKAQPLDARFPVPVSERFPDGWARNGDLEVGDLVFAADGQSVAVRSFSAVQESEEFEVVLSDGQAIRCSGDHVWLVSSAASRAAHGTAPVSKRDARARRYAGDAGRVRELSSSIPAGTVAAMSTIAGMAQVQLGRGYAVMPAGMSLPIMVPTGVVRGYPVDETLLRIADSLQAQGQVPSSAGVPAPLEQLLTTEQMSSSDAANYAIRVADPVDPAKADLPLDPYLVGAWLGDGHPWHAEITSSTPASCTDETGLTDQDHMLTQLRAAGFDAVPKQSAAATVVTIRGGVHKTLREMGLLGNKHIPPVYLRSSYKQRLALIQGLMDAGGRVGEDGGCELTLCEKRLATDALELVRSLGIKAAMHASDGVRPVTSTRYRIVFTTDQPVFRLPRKASRIPTQTRGTHKLLYVIEVRATNRVVPMRCLVVDHPQHLYLTDGFVVTHNSVTAQNILWGAAVKGYTVVVIDPMKQAADFQFLAEHAAGFAVDLFEAAALLKAVYAQVRQRMTLNAVHKVGNYRELPEDVRPEPLLVFIDEFTSLMGKDAPPAASEDPEVQDEIAAVKAANDARATIGTLVGKMAREARSAGVHLVLGTQKLKQDVLDKVPSASELKTNLARSLMGNATRGDRTSALRNGDDAPELGESTPPGRGLFEPLTTPVALAIQCWFAPQGTGASGAGPGTLAFELSARVPALDPSRRLDFSPFLSGHPGDDGHVYGPPPGFGTGVPDAGPGPSGSEELGPTVLDLGEIDLDLDLDLEEAAFTDADEFEFGLGGTTTTPNTTSETDQDEQNDRAQHSDQDQPTGEAAAGPGSATQVGAHGATSAHRATSGPGLVVAPQEPTAGLPDRGGTDAAVGGDADRGDLDHDGADGGTGRGGVPGVGQRGLLGPDDPDESDVHRVAGPGTPLPVVAPDRGGLSAEDLLD